LRLPEVDVDVIKATWHVYLPAALEPLSFDGNFVQYSAIRYDPFRRARDFLRRAFFVRDAWAGGRYSSILSQRKAIYRREVQQKARGAAAVLASFPLVGERYRFKRQLLGGETPVLTATYVDRSIAPWVRWGAFAAALILGLLLLAAPADRRRWIGAGAGLVLLLALAHFFLGVHRRVLWGVDVALLLAWLRVGLRPAGRALLGGLRRPWRWGRLLRLGNLLSLLAFCLVLGILSAFPLLLSTFLCVALTVVWRRAYGRAAQEEVAHA
jgi:hypothetical protein